MSSNGNKSIKLNNFKMSGIKSEDQYGIFNAWSLQTKFELQSFKLWRFVDGETTIFTSKEERTKLDFESRYQTEQDFFDSKREEYNVEIHFNEENFAEIVGEQWTKYEVKTNRLVEAFYSILSDLKALCYSAIVKSLDETAISYFVTGYEDNGDPRILWKRFINYFQRDSVIIVQNLTDQLESIKMVPNETIHELAFRMTGIINRIQCHGKSIEESTKISILMKACQGNDVLKYAMVGIMMRDTPATFNEFIGLLEGVILRFGDSGHSNSSLFAPGTKSESNRILKLEKQIFRYKKSNRRLATKNKQLSSSANVTKAVSKDIVCYHCGEKGHKKNKCPQIKKPKLSDDSLNINITKLSNGLDPAINKVTSSNKQVVFDSGGEVTVFNNVYESMTNLKPSSSKLVFGNSQSAQVESVASIGYLDNVHICTGCNEDILSMSQMADTGRITIITSCRMYTLKAGVKLDINEKDIELTADRDGGLYKANTMDVIQVLSGIPN